MFWRVKTDDEFDKLVDLKPDEYSYRGKYEPAFGPGAKYFFIMLVLGLVLVRPASWLADELLILAGVLDPPPSAASVYPYWLPLPQE